MWRRYHQPLFIYLFNNQLLIFIGFPFDFSHHNKIYKCLQDTLDNSHLCLYNINFRPLLNIYHLLHIDQTIIASQPPYNQTLMASTDKPDRESIKSEEAPAAPPRRSNYSSVHVALRVLLFAASVTAVVVMVTAKQTEIVPVPGLPISVPLEAKFSDSPAFM